MPSLKLLFACFVFVFALENTTHAQTTPIQVNTCSPCSTSSECSNGQVCINELNTATNPLWEWTIKELSQVPENQDLTGWDQFEYGKYKTFRAVAKGRVHTRNVIDNKWGSWQELERFTCGSACGEGDFIYSVNVMEKGGLITFHLTRSGGDLCKIICSR